MCGNYLPSFSPPAQEMKLKALLFALVIGCLVAGCSSQKETPSKGSAPAPATSAAPAPSKPIAGQDPAANDPLPPPANEIALPENLRSLVDKPFTGDLEAMTQRRLIRAGVPFNRTFYFIDKGTQRGLSYEYLALFEDRLNQKVKSGNLKVHVVLLPMPRDMLLPALQTGKLDLVLAQLTDTPERRRIVDFSNPTRSDVNEIVVTGPGSPVMQSLDDLSGKTVFVRRTSSYYDSLQALNRQLTAKGKAAVDVRQASDNLEDDDLLEMVNGGLIPATVVDSYLADYWKQVFTHIVIHSKMAVRTSGHLAVAFRKNSPELASAVNGFIAKNGLNSAMGRVLSQRYLQSTKYVRDAASEAERKKFLTTIDLFRRYGDRYQFDYLMMAAQGYQESRLDQDAKSPVGAVGIMQLMPETGREQNVGDIRQLEPNIHAGVKYMRHLRNEFFDDQPMDDLNKGLFTFASYNAGPGRIKQLRREAERRGLNPNVWFGNVERIASERIGRETVTYVSNIYKYYVAYRLIADEQAKRSALKSKQGRAHSSVNETYTNRPSR
jgi:membrane-bound lytic murein transglycosylase MltF